MKVDLTFRFSGKGAGTTMAIEPRFSSANIAAASRRLIRLLDSTNPSRAKEKGVAVGAHPKFSTDSKRFGRARNAGQRRRRFYRNRG